MTASLLLAVTLPPLADGIGTIIGIIFFVVASLAQLIGNRQDKAKQRLQRRAPHDGPRQPPGPLQPPGRGQPGPRQQVPAQQLTIEEQVHREVEEFLNRAQGKPAEPLRPIARQADQKLGQPLSPRERDLRRKQQADARQRGDRPQRDSQATPPRRPTAVRLEPPSQEPSHHAESVSEHVTHHIHSHADATERLSHLGEEVGHADERMEEHLRTKFDHKLGSLERKAVAKQEREPTIAEEVFDLLASPTGMRKLIVANEILKRPDWD